MISFSVQEYLCHSSSISAAGLVSHNHPVIFKYKGKLSNHVLNTVLWEQNPVEKVPTEHRTQLKKLF